MSFKDSVSAAEDSTVAAAPKSAAAGVSFVGNGAATADDPEVAEAARAAPTETSPIRRRRSACDRDWGCIEGP